MPDIRDEVNCLRTEALSELMKEQPGSTNEAYLNGRVKALGDVLDLLAPT